MRDKKYSSKLIAKYKVLNRMLGLKQQGVLV